MATRARILADYVSGGATAAEFDYLDGVTSNIQTQFTAKAPLASPTFTGTTTVSGDLVPSTALSNRNMIINGAMQVSQRGASFTTSSGGIYTLDRWRLYENATGNLTISQDTSAPDGFSHSLKVLVETVDASIGAAEQIKLHQKIEAFNTTHLAFGTSSAENLVLSFWVKSSVTGTFGCALINAAEDRSYVKEYTISSADTWEKKTLTIAGDTSGTWVKGTNASSLQVLWSMGVGTDRENTANTWHASSEYQTSSCTNLIETAGATWFITGVQLELGSNATPFEHRSYADELQRCQRYYQRYGSPKTFTAGTHYYNSTIFFWCLPQDNDDCSGSHILPVEMRTSPTASITESLIRLSNNANNKSSGNVIQAQYCSSSHFSIHIDLTGTDLDVNNVIAFSFTSTAGYYDLSAEL